MFRLLLTTLLLSAAIANGADVSHRSQVDLRDDATLHDVQFVGKTGWACGDHGAFWRTEDGGEHWHLVNLPVTCSWKSLCFLTDRIGWMAGGEISPWTKSDAGYLVYTSDGGLTWTVLANRSLPALHHVQFFGLEEGVCVGSKNSQFGTGLFRTQDGGATWEEIAGPFDKPWRTGAFVTPTLGVIAGQQGALSVWSGNDLKSSQLTSIGNNAIRGISLDQEFNGWMVGDGAMLYRTRLGGTAWEQPAVDLTTPLRDFVDFQCVAHHGQSVWVAGRPGTVIWHSNDDGNTWQAQWTGQSIPIHSLHFSDVQTGFAVGALGQILKTTDGGLRWNVVRGQNRRSAFMVIAARPQSVPYSAVTQLSEELGYRSQILVPVLDETGQTTRELNQFDLRFDAAALSAGASRGDLRTRLPIGVPDAQVNRERLLQEWNRRTDGRLSEVLFSDLVSQIRTWRPEVILLDHAAEGDETAALVNLAVMQAVDQANDPTQMTQLAQSVGLMPWNVKRIYERTAPGETGHWRLRTRNFLPHVGEMLGDETRESLSLITETEFDVPQHESYRLVANSDPQSVPGSGDPFSGLSIPPGSDIRRELAPINEQMLPSADRTRTREQFLAVSESIVGDGLDPARTVAILDSHLQKLTPEEASRDLLKLCERHLSQASWDSAEAILIELVNRYPNQPSGQAGMAHLLKLWSSEELFWQRSRNVGTPERLAAVNPLEVQKILQNPIDSRQNAELFNQPPMSRPSVSTNVLQTSAALPDINGDRMRTAAAERWRHQAGMLGVAVWSKNPSLFRQPEIQLPLTSAARSPEVAARMENLIREIDPTGFGPGMTLASWLQPPRTTPQPVTAVAYSAPARPQLDGILSDDCWKEANAVPLGRDDAERQSGAPAITMLAWDSEYIYLSASCQKLPGVAMDGPQTAGRTHDRDVTSHDRITFSFDLDRDYLTYYEITIDERGWTQERCCGHAFWNPEMFIAVDADETHWRIEAAIRIADLSPGSISPGNGWGMSISRSVPGEGWHNFTGTSQNIRPQLDNFGIVRFEGQSGN